jgi:hypothetical protein
LSPLDEAEQDTMRGYLSRLLDSLSAQSVEDEEELDGEEFTEEYRRPGVQRF